MFAFPAGSLFSLLTHALTCLRSGQAPKKVLPPKKFACWQHTCDAWVITWRLGLQAPLVARNHTLFRHVVSEHTKASQFPTPATIREWPVQAFGSTIIGILNGCLESHRRIDIITNVFRPRYPRYHCALNCIQVNSLEFLGWRIAVSVNKIYITLQDQILVMLFTI